MRVDEWMRLMLGATSAVGSVCPNVKLLLEDSMDECKEGLWFTMMSQCHTVTTQRWGSHRQMHDDVHCSESGVLFAQHCLRLQHMEMVKTKER